MELHISLCPGFLLKAIYSSNILLVHKVKDMHQKVKKLISYKIHKVKMCSNVLQISQRNNSSWNNQKVCSPLKRTHLKLLEKKSKIIFHILKRIKTLKENVFTLRHCKISVRHCIHSCFSVFSAFCPLHREG